LNIDATKLKFINFPGK